MIPKFRAYDGSINRMYGPEEVWVNDDNIYIDHEDFEAGELVQNNDIELMQSTGLFDKNGVEIFEGDILKNKDYPKMIFVCKQSDKRPAYICLENNNLQILSLWTDEQTFWEVIGNIYENSDLVEV